MAVRFREIVFHNENNIAVSLAVEAPIGTSLGPAQNVPPNSPATIRPAVDNCLSVQLSVTDGAHGNLVQSFIVAPPRAGMSSFLESLTARHFVGSIHGKFVARTEGID